MSYSARNPCWHQHVAAEVHKTMTKRILILYTGGTIGMVPSTQGYQPAAGFEARLRQQLDHQQHKSTVPLPEFDVLEFDTLIDSANLQPSDWSNIAHQLHQHWQNYAGFVVLHGTDTMAYTASALSFMLQGLDRPVIVTGSQIPLEQPRNDALGNLSASLILAARNDLFEVALYFDGKLLRGNRSSKIHSIAFSAFGSPNFPVLGEAGIYFTLAKNLLLPAGTLQATIPHFNPEAVAVLPIYPGLQANVLNALLSNKPQGLILQSYGVGNPPSTNTELMALIEQATRQGITVVNLTQCHQGPVVQGAYATGATLNNIGVVPGSDLTFEAAFTKLHWLLAQGFSTDQIRQHMADSLCGECD